MTFAFPTLPMALTGVLFAAGETAIGDDSSLVRYAVTQGGLLAVVLVLLYFQRQNERERALRVNERLDTLMSIVEKSTDAHVANALAISRLATSVERFEKLPPATCLNFRSNSEK